MLDLICPKMTWCLLKGGHCSVDDKSVLVLGGWPKGQDVILSLSVSLIDL